ncbi:metallophosphoesterase [Variovorax guangxiensis]|uniref:metallophosphoesterase family protein n=1 Tax=Variovorax guangxiensis TaxID=1775474 RepID=UPI0028630933|nr:metallophosphoesterase [Variovorax guangxiensis]MDR6859832.1 3',5'-cyclic AMP phosphodiesterase CpdA [Variovorax guangxiensis]
MNEDRWRHLNVLHLSDLHFGDKHAFNPVVAPDGAPGAVRGRPTLFESVLSDVGRLLPGIRGHGLDAVPEDGGVPEERTIVTLTGDLTERAQTPQFDLAQTFMQSFAAGLGLGLRDIFVVPGNHDLSYDEAATADRWARYCRFYERHAEAVSRLNGSAAPRFQPETPQALTRIIDQSDVGLIVAEINSSAYVQRGTADERRGQVDEEAIDALDEQLKAIDEGKRRRSIRLALIHHHPAVLPGLADPGEGYDAVVNADQLLGMLKRHAFHAVLHGHKHTPHAFTYDPVCAWTRDPVRPLMVIAGGSAGSTELRREPGATNTYNIVRIKWHPDAPQARIHVETRGHVIHDEDGRLMPGPRWHWQMLRLDDRLLSATRSPAPRAGTTRKRDPQHDEAYERERANAIASTRRNFPVIEVMPSLDPQQGYEARVRIEAQTDKLDYVAPDRVEWSAGPLFPEIHVVRRDQSPQFNARFSYHGPMLIQARLYWDGELEADRYECQAYVFAHFPGRGEQIEPD